MICKNKSNSKRKKDRIEVADSSLGSVDIHPIRLSRDDDSRFHSDMKTISVKNHSEDITVKLDNTPMKNKEDLADAYINQFISLSKFDHTRPKQKEAKRGKNKIPKPKKNNGGKKKQVNQSSNLDASMADFMNKRKILKRSTSESFMLPQSSIEKPISPYDQAYTKDALLKISADYDYLKEKVLKLQQKLTESERDNKELEKQLETIKTQNIMKNANCEIMHSELMDTMAKVQRRLDELERENMCLKAALGGGFGADQMTTEVEQEVTEESDGEGKVFIGDSMPQNYENESRFMPFNPVKGFVGYPSDENFDVSNVSDQKSAEQLPLQAQSKPQKKRFLIPKPESRAMINLDSSSQE